MKLFAPSVLCTVLVVVTACASVSTTLPEEALRLASGEQAGLYGATARHLAEIATVADVNSALQGVNKFYVLDRPTLELASLEQASSLEPFDDVVLEAIRDGIGGQVIFVEEPADALVPGEHQVPLTTLPGQDGPDAESVQGLIAPHGSVLVMFGVPYPAWGGGFSGGDWPSDAEMAVDLKCVAIPHSIGEVDAHPGRREAGRRVECCGFPHDRNDDHYRLTASAAAAR